MRKAVALAAVAAGVLTVGVASAAGPVITKLTYSPKPLYNDVIGVTVSFTATRDAKRGYEWGVMLNISGEEPAFSCSAMMLSWDPVLGGNARRHMQSKGKHSVLLRGQRASGTYICRGRAWLQVVERRIGTDWTGTFIKGGALHFRVAEAR